MRLLAEELGTNQQLKREEKEVKKGWGKIKVLIPPDAKLTNKWKRCRKEYEIQSTLAYKLLY